MKLGVCVLCVGEMQGGLEGMWGMNVFIFYVYTKEILNTYLMERIFFKKTVKCFFFSN